MEYRRSTVLTLRKVAVVGLFGALVGASGWVQAGYVGPGHAQRVYAQAGDVPSQPSALPLTPPAAQSPTSPTPPSTALAFVKDRHLGESLGWLGYQVASRTVTFTTLVETVGRTKAQEIVQDELQYLQPQYQQQWDQNLAAAYSASFTPEELIALDAGDPPPDVANKFRAKQRDVGMDMKGRSSELLKVYVSTALDNALKKAKP